MNNKYLIALAAAPVLLSVTPVASADVAPKVAPGVYTITECENIELTNCEDPVPGRQWRVEDVPGAVRVSRLPDPAIDAATPPWTVDLLRTTNRWSGQYVGGGCANDQGQWLSAQRPITLTFADNGQVYTDYGPIGNPACGSAGADDGDFYRLAPA